MSSPAPPEDLPTETPRFRRSSPSGVTVREMEKLRRTLGWIGRITVPCSSLPAQPRSWSAWSVTSLQPRLLSTAASPPTSSAPAAGPWAAPCSPVLSVAAPTYSTGQLSDEIISTLLMPPMYTSVFEKLKNCSDFTQSCTKAAA